MRQDRFSQRLEEICAYFESYPQRVFSKPEITGLLLALQPEWSLPRRMTTDVFLLRMSEKTPLMHVPVAFPRRTHNYWTWGEVDPLDLLMHLDSRCFASHLTAAEFHGLTNSPSESLYINIEQPKGSDTDASLEQYRIDAAFKRPPRVSNTFGELDGKRVYLLNGKNTNQYGVETLEHKDSKGERTYKLKVTNLERTLIDMTVRPQYSGGVDGCLEAFKNAALRLSVPKLCDALARIGHVYPYHQSVGFYMEASGRYGANDLRLLKEFPQEFDFYLDNQIEDPHYVPEWRLHVPSRFTNLGH
ncbi:type IV toxin-antitoxin system AbiEi family antitoxin domain-containing protein [Fimbriimonas ginsengisoli]|uniref:AbiEi antitoxin C-terminal domain-containing protein n=1 Tax=Fimbriimonas ginsengisoli Gsoil 348 TaxID=661478 RepID=A0A068NJM7_FIMGI|nr:hypothetical protein [Fimbriimonas ginsengisoli]AIE83652.1 hypothetical protein OP10G_0284 [Fimbriimonas ginsengisoli Gsoil 348]